MNQRSDLRCVYTGYSKEQMMTIYSYRTATCYAFPQHVKGIVIHWENAMTPVFSFINYCLFYH